MFSKTVELDDLIFFTTEGRSTRRAQSFDEYNVFYEYSL